MHILVVEDDPVLADALTQSLRGLDYAVDCLTTGGDADRALTTDDYDLVILDVDLPQLDGFEVLRRLRNRKNKVPVIMLTVHDAVYERIHGLNSGADDYLTKPFTMGELEARIRALIRRAHGAAENVISLGRLSVDLQSHVAAVDMTALDLSAREFAVLEFLASHAGQVVSKDALIRSVYDWNEDVGTNAVEIQVHRIRKKLRDADVTIRTIRGLGYLLEPAQKPATAAEDAV